jgi:N-methylhydantoinase B
MPARGFHLWQNLTERILAPFPAAALVTFEGELLVSRAATLADIGTLPVAALTCYQYFKPKTGDVIVVNDPYSGGTLLSSITLVTAVSTEGEVGRSIPGEALLVVRLPLKPRVVLSESVEQEGVRIPPTPLVSDGVLNQQILAAIAAHPLAPQHLKPGIERALDWLRVAGAEFARLKKLTGENLSKRVIKDWLQLSQDRFFEALGELAVGTARTEVAIGDRSRICLSIEIKNHRVAFNFTGSGTPDRYALSDAATMGACVGALVASLRANVPINSGVFRLIDVVAPLGSIVHARYPSPVSLGFTDGVEAVAGIVLRLLGQVDSKLQIAGQGLSQCAMEIDFGNGSYFFDDLEPGTAGSRDRRGVDGVDLWRRSHLHRSIEMIEKLYPLRVRSAAFRSDSGGSGQYGGGNGQTKVLEVLAPARLSWNLSRGILKPEGASGGKSAIGADIACQKPGEPSENLPDHGTRQLQTGDLVIVHSSGGGGFGEA